MDTGVFSVVAYVLSALAVAYTVWKIFFPMRGGGTNEEENKRGDPPDGETKDIVGKSRFVLPLSGQSRPQAAVEPESEPDTQKEPIFVPSSVSGHPRQIPPEEMDGVFGDVPEGEENAPMDVDVPLTYKPFPDKDAEQPEDPEDESEDLPLRGVSLALGIGFKHLGEAYRHVVHDQVITDEQKEETGRILTGLKGTDMFEAIVSAQPEGEDRVGTLMGIYMSALRKRIAEREAESRPPLKPIPDGFDPQKFM